MAGAPVLKMLLVYLLEQTFPPLRTLRQLSQSLPRREENSLSKLWVSGRPVLSTVMRVKTPHGT